ncbi:hypothetical protein Pmani_030661 [Petrolisthes manimaculis]|uniref:Uncharacterized protein n=1 Tax=Petrolisthes manimaculis TaxID=1843537 RepID=A0AAE1NX48_9EUCA|nr:hypothetical protein Pmani_030661 [Petrolisthes manimaculis]
MILAAIVDVTLVLLATKHKHNQVWQGNSRICHTPHISMFLYLDIQNIEEKIQKSSVQDETPGWFVEVRLQHGPDVLKYLTLAAEM